MKTTLKLLAVVIVLAILLIGGFMGTISFMRAKSHRQITQLVSEIRPGMPFTNVASRLGREVRTLTEAYDVERYGTAKQASIVTNSVLHVFAHEDRPWFYWIHVYTDTRSEAVIYASWREE
jgi:hypothetical protein